MRTTTYPSKQATPPIQVLHCPAGDGHYWAALNPNWYSDSRPYRQGEHWCPDHQEEKKAYISAMRAEQGAQTPRVYMNGEPPPSRMCLNPDPETHPARAVLPRAKFYRRTHKRRDGSKYTSLDPWCKECRRAAQKAYRERMIRENPKEWARREKKRGKSNRARRRRGTKALQNETDKRLDAAPFREWLRRYADTTGFSIAEIARRCGINRQTLQSSIQKDRTKVSRSIVDKVAAGTDKPTLLRDLYG